jgi:hypothetical protein
MCNRRLMVRIEVLLKAQLKLIFILKEKFNRYKRAANQSMCNFSYVPSGNDSCESCSNVYYTQNARIVGGSQAVAYSWPAQVLVVETIQGVYKIQTSSYSITKSYLCAGTLINRYTVLTAGHCVQTEFTSTINNLSYTFKVNNPYDPSQFTVYVGVYDKSFLNSGSDPIYPTRKMSVSKVIRVSNNLYLFNCSVRRIVITGSLCNYYRYMEK